MGNLLKKLNLHTDEKFSLKEDLVELFTQPLLLIPVLLIFLANGILGSSFGYLYSSIWDYTVYLRSISVFTLFVFLKRVLLPIILIYLMKRSLLEYKHNKSRHILMGASEFLIPGVYYFIFLWLGARFLSYLEPFLPNPLIKIMVINTFLPMILTSILVTMVMNRINSRREDLSFFAAGFELSMHQFLVLFPFWLLRAFLVWSFGFNPTIESVLSIVLVIITVLVYLRSSRQIVMKRGLHRYT